jgi:hypothetical protein
VLAAAEDWINWRREILAMTLGLHSGEGGRDAAPAIVIGRAAQNQ